MSLRRNFIPRRGLSLAEITEVLADLYDQPILNGHLIEDIEITSGTPYTLNHGLDSVIQGYIVVKRNANATVWDSDDATRQTITLNSSANVTVDLWVF